MDDACGPPSAARSTLSSATLKEMATFLNAGANERSPYLDALQHAGGMPKVVGPYGTVTRMNALTGAQSAKCCAWCQSVSATLKSCSRCNAVFYCDRECQRSHWSTHKRPCKSLCKASDECNLVVDPGGSSKMMKWLIKMPQMIDRLAEASGTMEREGHLVPIVHIVRGENDRRAVMGYVNNRTPKELEEVRAKYPGFGDIIRTDDVPLPHPFRRVVVIVTHQGNTTVGRLRVIAAQ